MLLSINSESAEWTQFDFCRSVNGMRGGGDQLYNIVGVYKHIYIQTLHIYIIYVLSLMSIVLAVDKAESQCVLYYYYMVYIILYYIIRDCCRVVERVV